MDNFPDLATGAYGFAIIGGPILLAIALAYGIRRSRRKRGVGREL